jgi:hypothetical protein
MPQTLVDVSRIKDRTVSVAVDVLGTELQADTGSGDLVRAISPVLDSPTVVTGTVGLSTSNALEAAGTDRDTSLALTAQINNVTTAAASTGVTLPAGVVGRFYIVFNAGANAITVYGDGSDTIDGVAGSTGVPLTNGNRCVYFCVAANTLISAKLGAVSD